MTRDEADLMAINLMRKILKPFIEAYDHSPSNPTFLQVVHGLHVVDFKQASKAYHLLFDEPST